MTKQTDARDAEFARVFKLAKETAKDAVDAEAKRLFGGNDGGACGFGWVVVRPGNTPFVAWCKRQKAALEALGLQRDANKYGDKNWNGGWQFWNPGEWPGQSIDIKEAGAVAFQRVIAIELGLSQVEAGSRLD